MFEFFFKYPRANFERGEFLFASSWPIWLLFALLLVAAAAVSVSLVRNRHDLGWFRLGVIGLFQFAPLALLLAMLWQPSLLTQQLRPNENSITMLVDTSASMSYGDGEQSRLQQVVSEFDDGALGDLEENFSVDLVGFSGQTFSLPSLSEVPAPGSTTDIGEALLSVLRGSSAGAMAAIVLVSDGADNTGGLSPTTLAEIAGFGVPVHTVGVGREVIEDDIELSDVILAPQSAPGATVSAQVSIRHGRGGLANLKVYDGDAILVSEPVSLPSNPGVTTRWVDIEVGTAGIRDLRFTIDPIEGETNLINNTQLRPMEVPERRRSVLYFEGEPRWEYKFLRRAVVDDESPIRLATLLRTTPNKYYRQGLLSGDELAEGFPTTREELFAYDAVIIGSLEASALTEEQREMVKEFVSVRGGTLLMLGAIRGLADGGWGATVVGDVLPAWLPVTETAATFAREPVRAVLPEDVDSLITQLAANDEENRLIWAELPELADFQAIPADQLKPGAEVLLRAEFRGDDSWPLLFRHRFGQGSAYVLAGSTWRWQMLLEHTDQKHETFWRQLMQAITASVPAPVTLTSKQVYYGDESRVVFEADVRDKTYQPAAGATVNMTVDEPGGGVRELAMRAVPGVPGRYEMTVDADLTGIYRVQTEASLDDESLGRSRLAIRRDDGVSEHFNLQQNRPLLERVAAATGGRYFALNDANQLAEAVQYSDAGIIERRLLALWSMPILFLLLVLFKGGEWILRLFWGRL